MQSLIQALKDLLLLVYPEQCVCCNKTQPLQNQLFCFQCLVDLPLTQHFSTKENEVKMKLWGRVYVEFAAALLYMPIPGKVHQMITQFKYKGDKRIGKWAGQIFANKLLHIPNFSRPDFIVPVPIHKAKLKKRGFNQTEIFAHSISAKTQIPVVNDLIYKTKNTNSQTTKGRVERIANTFTSFQLNHSNTFKGAHILLVDDVLTTGATLEACASLLKKIPDIRISIGIIAMTKS